MTVRDSLLAALVATVWGFNFVVIDWGMRGVPPLLFVTMRFVAVLIPAVFILPRPNATWRVILAVGTFMSLGQFSFVYLSLDAGLPPGLAALVLQAQVIFTVVIAAVVLRERPQRMQVAGLLVGVAGLAIVGLGRGGDIPLVALLLCLCGALSWSIGNVISRSSGVTGGLSLTVWSALVVPLPAFVLALLVDGSSEVVDGLQTFGWKSAVSTLYTAGIASLFGYGVFNTLLSRNPSADVVPFVLLAPVVAMASAALLLDQVPNGLETLGAVVMVSGVLVALRSARTGPPARPPKSMPSGQQLGAMSDSDMLNRVRTHLNKRRKKLLQKEISISGDADAQASADTMKRKTPTHSQIRSTGG